MSDPIAFRMTGGPFDGNTGEADSPAPVAIAPLPGFLYDLQPGDGKVREYRYNPTLSPSHQAVVDADKDAIREVAEKEGISVDAVLARARERRAAAKSGPKPAEMLFAEAERLGCSVEQLLTEGFDVSSLYVPGRTP